MSALEEYQRQFKLLADAINEAVNTLVRIYDFSTDQDSRADAAGALEKIRLATGTRSRITPAPVEVGANEPDKFEYPVG